MILTAPLLSFALWPSESRQVCPAEGAIAIIQSCKLSKNCAISPARASKLLLALFTGARLGQFPLAWNSARTTRSPGAARFPERWS
jgi:hypothetical protein